MTDYAVDILRGTTEYSLSNGNPYWALTLTGIGMPPTRLIKERGPQQHGSTVVGFLLDERIINLSVLIEAASEALADQYRDDLAEIIKPVEDVPCSIRIRRKDGQYRQIDAYTVGMVDFPYTQETRTAGTQMVVCQFEAPDPIPFDPELNNVVFDTSGGSGYTVPVSIPFKYSTGSGINRLISLDYEGKWRVFPIIYATGPAEDLIITNETTGKFLSFEGHTIPGGVTYEIDLRYGYKTITDSLGVRQNAALTDDSNLVDFALETTPTAPGGTNDIRVEVADQATGATQIRMEYYDRYPNLG